MHKKLSLLLLTLLLFFTSVSAQKKTIQKGDKCATVKLLELTLARNPTLKIKYEQEKIRFNKAVSNKLNRTSSSANTINRTVATIPIVFHIVATNPNLITDAQIQAQLDTLNKGFGGTNSDSTNIPSYFKPLFAKSGLQFCLAQRTPQGEGTTGIERYTTTRTSFSVDQDDVKFSVFGGADIWDPNRYFNVWLCILDDGTLGYSTMPGGEPDNNHKGVVIDYRALPGGTFQQYNQGKTLTHEAGHYFNLDHIWGLNDNGTCADSDEVDDTPNQSGPTFGRNTGIKTDECTPTGSGIMYQNYMDYSDDRSMFLFTNGQAIRMEDAAVAYRSSLLTSNGCVRVTPRTYNVQLTAITQPGQRICTNTFTPAITIRNRGSQTLTSFTINARIDNGAVTSYAWSGSLAYLGTASVTLGNLATAAGRHTLTIYTTQPNNNQDQDRSNDTLTTTYQYVAPVNSFSQGFESTTFPPPGFDIVNPDRYTTWQRVTNASKTGSASIKINNLMYDPNFDYRFIGQKDDLILPNISLAGADSAFLTFQVAAAAYTPLNTSDNNWDTLEVLASTDCGVTYTSIYKKWGSTLVTRQTETTNEFVPNANEWRKDSIDLTSLIGQGNLLLTMRNTTGMENSVYLDDINLRTVSINPNLKKTGFLVTPNPTSGNIAVQFYPNPPNLSAIQIFSMTGQKLKEILVNGPGSNYYSLDLGPYAAGTYIVRVIFTDHVITEKILKY